MTGQLECGLLVGAVFTVGEGDGESSGDEEDPVFGKGPPTKAVGRLCVLHTCVYITLYYSAVRYSILV